MGYYVRRMHKYNIIRHLILLHILIQEWRTLSSTIVNVLLTSLLLYCITCLAHSHMPQIQATY